MKMAEEGRERGREGGRLAEEGGGGLISGV